MKAPVRYLFSSETPPPYAVRRSGRRYQVVWWRTEETVIDGIFKEDAQELADLLNRKLKKGLDSRARSVAR